jgi:hypothetical protein
MDAVTYPNADVIELVQEEVVPLRVPSDAKPLADNFNIQWTPTVLILDSDGQEHHRTTGFLAPQEFLPMVLLGVGKLRFDRGDFDEAIGRMERLLSEYPQSDSAPEAVYYRGVSRYKITEKADPLIETYEVLRTQYPSSPWARKAAPYRLL